MTEPLFRAIEPDVTTDLHDRMTYAGYLDLSTLLSAQKPVSGHHDEMLFIIQHHVTELWLKLLITELTSARELISQDNLPPALKRLARIKAVQKQMFEQWAVLETLTPIEYAQFRDDLGSASGFQSPQYRAVEFMLGNKNASMLNVFEHDQRLHDELKRVLIAPSLYDEFLRYLSRRGYDVPSHVTDRDFSQPYRPDDGVIAVFQTVYQDPDTHWVAYEMSEELVDLEENFQLWRFRHMKTVERIIGFKRGTGGSSGVAFLKKALDLTFFPELLDVRTHLGE